MGDNYNQYNNYNQYSGYPWEGNRGQAQRGMQQSNRQEMPQQYIGFQEFLSQYQHYPGGQQYRQPAPQYSRNPETLGYAVPNHYQYNNTYNNVNSQVNQASALGYQSKQANIPGNTYQNSKHEDKNALGEFLGASTSKLTPTAQEFVPSSSRVEHSSAATNPNSKVESTVVKNKNEKYSPAKTATNNSRKSSNHNDSKRSSNWRDRDENADNATHSNSAPGEIENKSDKKDANKNGSKGRDSYQNRNKSERNSAHEREKNSYDDRERNGANNDKERGATYNDRSSSYGDREKNSYNDRNRGNRNSRMQNIDHPNEDREADPPANPKSYRSQRSNDYQNSDRRYNDYRNTDSSRGRMQRYDDDNGDSYRGGRSQRPQSEQQSSERYYRSQNSEYHEDETDNSRYNNRSKSYMSNETFRQKTYPKKYDGYGNKENDQDYNNYSRSGRNNRKDFFNPSLRKNDLQTPIKDIDGVEVSQRDRLTEQLNKGVLECLVCCERIRQVDSVWSCSNCFHVLHLSCIIRWAKSSIAEGSWRCPACQNNNSLVPSKYLCFCGKQTNPEWNRGGDSAHTCGSMCGRLPASCLRHPCTLLCHAGPCPQCDAVVQKKCECGASSQSLRCSHTQPLLCDQPCKKPLNCKAHLCQEKCHSGSCPPCQLTVDQECYCSKKTKRSLPCDVNTHGVFSYSCNEVCDKLLECKNHKCSRICHDNECNKCELLPEFVKKCPCGQTFLTAEQKRESCLDPIPVCDKICSKVFTCGPADAKHVCQKPCHLGECPPCPEKTTVPCRCGHINNPLPCIKLEEERDKVRCKKKCSKKQSCVRHRCKTLCCIDLDHRCPLPCNRSLTCGLHRCEDTCHSGHCDPCWRTGFDELTCRCGAAVRYPPIPCGTRPPLCERPCSIPRPCGHEPLHQCHPEPTACTPCTVLTQRYCHGRHKMRKTIPCHQEEFSCGLPCGKDLPCGKHKCIETCHSGSCPTVCNQHCEKERLGCSHLCGAACGHPDPCPVSAPCKKPVNVTCLCKRRTAIKACGDHMRDLQRLQATTGMLEGTMGQPVDIKALIEKGNTTTTLDCDDECYVEERNRRMAMGLQIKNPDVSSKLTPRYSDFMKQFLARDESFCVKVHEKLTELVLLAQKSKQKTRSHSFQPMNHLKRQFIHEYCDHFGCESKAYDSEPYRNIVATALREKSWLPALSLMEVVRREKGQRRVPGPVVGANSASNTQKLPTGGAWSTLGGNYASAANESTRLTAIEPEPPRKPKIDYFDAPPED